MAVFEMARLKSNQKEFVAPLSEGIITKEALEEWKKRIESNYESILSMKT